MSFNYKSRFASATFITDVDAKCKKYEAKFF